MLLHEPHANYTLNESDSFAYDFECRSARNVIDAVDDAYHLLRAMTESVPDVTLSDPFCSVKNFPFIFAYIR